MSEVNEAQPVTTAGEWTFRILVALQFTLMLISIATILLILLSGYRSMETMLEREPVKLKPLPRWRDIENECIAMKKVEKIEILLEEKNDFGFQNVTILVDGKLLPASRASITFEPDGTGTLKLDVNMLHVDIKPVFS